MRRTFLMLFTGLWLLASSLAEAAPPLADPTRPAGFAEPAPMSARPRLATPSPQAPGKLMSVQVLSQGRSSALVDGRVVHIGDRLGEWTVVAIDAQGIVLRGPHQDQRLALFPNVAKTASVGAPSSVYPAMNLATKSSR